MNASERHDQIQERRRQMPKLYRPIYDRAVQGKSRKAAIRAFCLECCGWQRIEVHLCTDVACPLYSYRPYQRLQPHDNAGVAHVEAPDTPEDGNLAGSLFL